MYDFSYSGEEYRDIDALINLTNKQLAQRTKRPMPNFKSNKQAAKSTEAQPAKAYLSAWAGDDNDKHVMGGYIKLTPAILEAIVTRIEAGEVGEYGLELSFRLYENDRGNVPYTGNAILKD